MEKGLKEHILDMAIIALVALASFGLGRLGTARPSEPLTIDYFAEARPLAAGAALAEASPGGVVASKKGTKYHLPWCSGAQTISEENRVYFESEEAAREAGYEPAKNCKGL